MWSLEVINYRNQAHAAGLTAYEVNFLSENKIFPVVGFQISNESLDKIQAFKEQNERAIMEDKDLKILTQLFNDLEYEEVTVSLTLHEMIEIITALKMRYRYVKRRRGSLKYQNKLKNIVRFLDAMLPI